MAGAPKTAEPWLVPVAGLRRSTGARRDEHRRGHIADLRVADSIVPHDADVDVDVMLTSIDGGIEVSGLVRSTWASDCRRCLRPVGGELAAEVREVYRPVAPGQAEDEETYALGTDFLDLAPLARDALLLTLPLAPLCQEDCAGLCASCGADLADGPCGCDTEPADPRWAALDALRGPGGADAGSTA